MKKYLLLFLATSALPASAAFNVYVTNNSDYNLTLRSVDRQISDYIPNPAQTVSPGVANRDNFIVLPKFPGVVEVVDLEYSFSDSTYGPRCHFRFTTINDYRTGTMIPQDVIADDENGRYNDRARCSGRLTGFNISTGEATVEFSMDRFKF